MSEHFHTPEKSENVGFADWTIVEPTDKTNISLEQAKPSTLLAGEEVTDKDIFKFAAWILSISAVLFVAYSIARVGVVWLADGESSELISAVEEVWGFASVVLNSIVSIIIGYYFGTKKINSVKG